VALVAGIVVLILAGIFRLAVVPAMLKFPTDLDVTPRYEGQQEIFVDPASGAPLAKPRELPLQITRHLKADGSKSTGSRVVIDEDITAVVRGGTTLRQQNRYVMDRKKIVNVADPKAFAFTPSNVVDRGSAYRLAFPFDLSQGTALTIYSNDTNSTYRATSDRARPTGDVDGLSVLNYVVRQRPHELSPIYVAGLQQAVGLPKSTTVRQLAAGLRRAGLNIAPVVAALPPQDQRRFARSQDRAVPLVYEEQVAGRFSVEPKTGSLVSIARDRSVVAVRPDPRALGPLLTILTRHGDLPAVASALPKLQAATATAQPVFALDYHQTQASIKDIRDTVGSTVLMVDAAKLWLPLGLLIVGLGLVAAGLRRRRSA
jgi:hypothetical protein